MRTRMRRLLLGVGMVAGLSLAGISQGNAYSTTDVASSAQGDVRTSDNSPGACTHDLKVWYDKDQFGTWPKAYTTWSGCANYEKWLQTEIWCDGEHISYKINGSSPDLQSSLYYLGQFNSCQAHVYGFIGNPVDSWYNWSWNGQPV